MSDDVFGIDSYNESVSNADFLQDTPQTGDTEAAPTEPAPSTTEAAPTPEPTTSERPRDEKGRFIKQEELYPGRQPTEEARPMAESKPETGDLPGETAQEKAERIWAGKYQNPDALEKGYRELRDLQRRTAERAKAYEQRVAEVEFQARQMEQSVRQAQEYVRALEQQQRQQLQQRPQQPVYDQFGNLVEQPQPQPMPQQGWTPEQIQAYTDQIVNQRLAEQASALQEQEWAQADYNMAAQAQANFFQKHPEVQKDGTVDEDLANTILALNDAWQNVDGSTVDIRNEDILEIAYEAMQRPALRSVLEKFPALIDDEGGMAQARALATQIDGAGTPAPASVTRMTPRQNTPVVERGSSPAPQQSSPLDEFDQAAAEYRAAFKSRGSDVLFGE